MLNIKRSAEGILDTCGVDEIEWQDHAPMLSVIQLRLCTSSLFKISKGRDVSKHTSEAVRLQCIHES